ncbi:sigma-54-dependent Fis family transcriptional regulator [Desulfobacca acetoxidans]|uniref:Transcriptional regulator, NifA, Fis Family n=1 Tax=Desulfobacca acetoxidans (strain ATCC 700848 / DSM 11109 / ASRB2) TaxID=880072 RepID=F2NEB4_DESAR|nr:sigma-54-dependent Fis family transcriptional regulator [Desulfobacca acetoxidans]AEB08104.1 transcriptional regulator, NifA, Fis Family [Desulfobacca acetoxidans DSM 11109]
MLEAESLGCLYEITQAINRPGSLKSGLQKILSILANGMGMNRGTITILNPDTRELQIEIAHGLTSEARRRGRYKLGEGITGRVVENGEPAIVPRISQEPTFLNRTRSRGDLQKQDISFICVPIKIGRQTIGALSVDRLYQEEIHLDADLQLLTIIASVIAQAVNNLMLIDQEKQRLQAENLKLREELQDKYNLDNIVGNSNKMRQVFEMIQRVAGSNATVLIRGESGTGKELVASAIHYNSKRARKPFIRVNCAALPETLVESELFGHEKGAFTGATQAKMGRFELAQRGTIFLDEIGDLSPTVQLKLLRVIQEREFIRVGGVKSMEVDVRIIAATHRDLEGLLANGSFREDLYYRLNVFPIYLPPLRERQTDIILLAEYFLQKYSQENNKNTKRISAPAIDLLMQYHWPGNVRELENVIERALLVCDEETIRTIHLPASLQNPDRSEGSKNTSLAAAIEHLEKEMIIEALRVSHGNQTQAAEYLDTSLRILGYKIKNYKINPKQYKTH